MTRGELGEKARARKGEARQEPQGPAAGSSAMVAVLVIAVTSGALILGAWIGARGWLSEAGEGLMVAGAGGALIVSVMAELVQPSLEQISLTATIAFVVLGAVLFSAADAWTDRRMAKAGGVGLLLAVTFDGVPENLALGTALIGTGPLGVAALAGSILMSNLPEAAGGAAAMKDDGRSDATILRVWTAVAVLLSLSALAGLWLLGDAAPEPIAAIQSFSAGAILASLSTEVFPKAGRRNPHLSGIAVAFGLAAALALQQLGEGG